MNPLRLFKSSSLRLLPQNMAPSNDSYAAQQASILDSYADSWKSGMKTIEGWVVEEVVVNAESAQKQWAREQGVQFTDDNWRESILEEQIRRFRPDVWFCHSQDISPAFRLRVRKDNPQLKFVFGYDGIDARRGDYFTGCDLLVVLLEETRAYYEACGYKSYVRKLGFDTSLLGRLSAGSGRYPVSFVGGLDLSKSGHNRRLELLSLVARELPLTLFTRPFPSGIRTFRRPLGCLRRLDFDGFSTALAQLAPIRRLEAINHGQVNGLAMYQTLADSQITLNCHIDAAGNTAANFRLFEATGVGACMVTDWKDNLPSLFEPDKEVVTYRTPAECVEKVKYLLEHPKERMEIAKNGQKRTVQDHSLTRSILPLLQWIRQRL